MTDIRTSSDISTPDWVRKYEKEYVNKKSGNMSKPDWVRKYEEHYVNKCRGSGPFWPVRSAKPGNRVRLRPKVERGADGDERFG
jgi:hypothetical protein